MTPFCRRQFSAFLRSHIARLTSTSCSTSATSSKMVWSLKRFAETSYQSLASTQDGTRSPVETDPDCSLNVVAPLIGWWQFHQTSPWACLFWNTSSIVQTVTPFFCNHWLIGRWSIQGDHLEVCLKQTLGSDMYWGAPSNIIHRSNTQGGSFYR